MRKSKYTFSCNQKLTSALRIQRSDHTSRNTTSFNKLESKSSQDYFQGNYIPLLSFKQIHNNMSHKKGENIVHIQTLMIVSKEIHDPC